MKKFKESDVNERVEGMHDYINKYEIKEDEEKCVELRKCIKGCRFFMRNAPKSMVNTLNNWIET